MAAGWISSSIRTLGRYGMRWLIWSHACARSKSSGRSTGSSVVAAATTRDARKVRRPASVPATRYQIPFLETRPYGVDSAYRRVLSRFCVGEVHLESGNDSSSKRCERRWCVLRRLTPVARVDVDGASAQVGLPAGGFRQCSEQLAQRRGQALLDAETSQQFRPGHEEQRLSLLRGEARQVDRVALGQGPPTTSPPLRVQRQPGKQQRVEVTPDRTFGHLEPPRQLGCGHLSVSLEEQRDSHQTIGAHERKIAAKQVTRLAGSSPTKARLGSSALR